MRALTSGGVHLGDVAELVRLPAVLSVPGDAWLGAAAAGRPARAAAMPAASAMIYLGGMALNDWADRDTDAVERPERPIPSGRIAPPVALAVGLGLLATGIAVAGAVAGRHGLAVATPLAGAVLLYDGLAKDTPAGPMVMAGCRALDVALGAAGGDVRRALPVAALIAAHTATVTAVSRHEVHGAPPVVPRLAAASTASIALAATALAARGATTRGRRPGGGRPRDRRGAPAQAAGVVLAAVGYAGTVGGAYLRAARSGGDAAAVRQAVGTGVMGIIPLQAGLLAGSGALVRAAAVTAAIPVGRALRRRRAVT